MPRPPSTAIKSGPARQMLARGARRFLPVSVHAWLMSGRRLAGTTRETWDREYTTGHWDYLDAVPELGRYSVIAGYCQVLRPRARILDVGCGKGVLARRLAGGASFAYVGIDLSDVAIDQAREPGLACSEFLVANATLFEPPHSFDVIVFNEILYYLEDPAQQVRRYAQHLAPGGIFVVSMYYSPSSFRTWKRLNGELKTLDHVTVSHRSSRLRFDVAVMTPL